MFDLTALQHVTFSASKYMQLRTKEATNYDTSASKIMKRGKLLGQTTDWVARGCWVSGALVTRVTGGAMWAAGASFTPHTVPLNHGAAYDIHPIV